MPAKSPAVTKRTPQEIRKSPRFETKKDHTTRKSGNINVSGSEGESDIEYSEQHLETGYSGKSPRVQARRSIRSTKCRKCKKNSSENIPESATLRNSDVCKCSEETSERVIQEKKSSHKKAIPKKTPSDSNISNILGNPYIWICLILLILSLFIGYFRLGYSSTEIPKSITIDSIKKKFPSQGNKLWKAVASGLNDTINFQHPTSYIFLHENEAENTTGNLLKELSEYAVCQLTNCSNTPINFNEVFESYETDYGSILSRYKPELQNSGVMIVENLDDVPEKFALAFHSFCDEISPLVEKSAFFFSMKVDKFEESPLMDVKYVEKTLKEKWKGIEDDQFGPLLTRIAAMLLRVNPEKEK